MTEDDGAATKELRLAAIHQLAQGLEGIIVPDDEHEGDSFFATDVQLAAFENALQSCPGYALEQTAILRQKAGEMARSLAGLYESEGHGSAIPDQIKDQLKQGVGNRIFVVDADTLLAVRRALTVRMHPGEADALEQEWISNPESMCGAEMIRAGRIVLVRNLSEYSWPQDENGPVALASPVDYSQNPLAPHNGQRLVVAEHYAARAVAEEIVHIFLDPTLPIALQEVIAKAVAADLLVYTGEDHALDAGLQHCRDYRDSVEVEHAPGFHVFARLGFGNLPWIGARTALVDRIERDARFKALLGEQYRDLFPDDDPNNDAYGLESPLS